MTQREFDRNIDELIRALASRMAFLQAVRDGRSSYRRVKVRAYKVDAYIVGSHERFIRAATRKELR